MEEGRGRSIAPGTPTPTHSPMGEQPTPLTEGIGAQAIGKPSHEFPCSYGGVVPRSEHLSQLHTVLYTEGDIRHWGVASAEDKARESN